MVSIYKDWQKNKSVALMSLLSIGGIALLVYLVYLSVAYGSDYGRLWQAARLTLDAGPSFMMNTFMAPLSTYMNVVLLLVGGLSMNILLVNSFFGIISVIALYALMRRLDVSNAAIVFSFLILGSSLLFLSILVDARPYLMANAFILTFALFFVRYLDSSLLKDLMFSSFFLVCACLSQAVFLPLVIVPGVYFVLSLFGKDRMSLGHIILFYLIPIIIMGPLYLYRFLRAGTDFYRVPLTWMYTEGFWSQINTKLFSRPDPGSWSYFAYFFEVAGRLLGNVMILLLPVLSLFQKWNAKKKFLCSWLFVSLIPVAAVLIPTESRYLFPALAPLLVLGALFSDFLLKKLRNVHQPLLKPILCAVILTLAISMTGSLSVLEERRASALQSKYSVETLTINIGEGGVYTRSHKNAPLLTNNRVYSITDLDLEDAIVLISWDHEDQVVSLLKERDIKYLLLHRDLLWEKQFHAWVTLANGEEPKHYINIRSSDCFNRINSNDDYILYELVC